MRQPTVPVEFKEGIPIIQAVFIIVTLSILIPLYGWSESFYHTVLPQETLSAIARRYRMDIRTVQEANQLTSETIYAGQILLVPLSQERSHRVLPGETLTGIARQYDLSVIYLKGLNRIAENLITIGQVLRLPRSAFQGESYRVQKGDTLSHIAILYQVSLAALMEANQLTDTGVRVGEDLRIPLQEEQELLTAVNAFYVVKYGETLSEIAVATDLTVKDIMEANDLTSSFVRAGEKLLLPSKKGGNYVVQKGDTLWEVATKNHLSVEEIKQSNHIRSDLIQPGQVLLLEQADKEVPVLLAGMDRHALSPALTKWSEYVHYRPSVLTQPSRNYSEERLEDPRVNYEQARRLLASFNDQIARESPLGNELEGFYIVLDPGHGGLDPGAIVSSYDGKGKEIYVVEDEYAYDITLRVYRLLKRHGAAVELTILSPNHTIRHGGEGAHTFVNEKNEVYNSLNLLTNEGETPWPVGGRRGLEKRMYVTKQFLGTLPKSVPKSKKIFVSIHNDNHPHIGQGKTVLFHEDAQEDVRAFAETLLPSLGKKAVVRGQPLVVLEETSDWIGVLVEVRNLAYVDNVWAIRNNVLREQDAEIIVGGLLAYRRTL